MNLEVFLEKKQGKKDEKLIQALQLVRLEVMTLLVTP